MKKKKIRRIITGTLAAVSIGAVAVCLAVPLAYENVQAADDLEGPKVISVDVDKTNVKPADVIRVRIKAEDQTGLNYGSVYFSNGRRNIGVHLNEINGGYLEGDLVIEEDYPNGIYTVSEIYLYDTLNNATYIFSREMDEEYKKSFIVNKNDDFEAPELLSFSLDKQEYDSWDTIGAVATAFDESHNDHMNAVFEAESGETIEIRLDENGQEELHGKTDLYGEPDGKYILKYVTVYDIVGNEKQYTPDDLDILRDIYFYVGESHKYTQINLKQGEKETIYVPYEGSAYITTPEGESVAVYNSDDTRVLINKTGITMSSAGNYITYQLVGMRPGNSVIQFISRNTSQLLAAYNVNVEQVEREQINTCMGEMVTFSVINSSGNIKTSIDEAASVRYIGTSEKSTSINGNKYTETVLTYTFENTGTFDVDIYDTNGEYLKGYSVNVREHIWDEVTSREATCTEDGVTEYICIYDSSHTNTEVLPAYGHNWGEWETVKEASDYEDGIMQRVCHNDPGHVEMQVIPHTAETVPASYDDVDKAINEIPDLSIYTDESVGNLLFVTESIIRDKTIEEQNVVDSYAFNIREAIKKLEVKPADYSALEEIILNIPNDDELQVYTYESVMVLKEALDSVNYDLKITEQEAVDSYAERILNAIDSLKPREKEPVTPAIVGPDDDQPAIPDEELPDGNQPAEPDEVVPDGNQPDGSDISGQDDTKDKSGEISEPVTSSESQDNKAVDGKTTNDDEPVSGQTSADNTKTDNTKTGNNVSGNKEVYSASTGSAGSVQPVTGSGVQAAVTGTKAASPQTGDESTTALWVACGAASAAALCGSMVIIKRKKKSD